MAQEAHPFIQLRRTIRQSGKQFRRNNDTSKSIFHPEGGFVYAYEMAKVEAALDRYEQTLPTEFQQEHNTLTI